MKIEDAIKQSSFRNEWQKASINIILTHSFLLKKIKTLLRPFGISIPQYNVLRILNGHFPEPISTSEIAKRMLDESSDASRIVDRMHTKGWVEKGVCKSDRRLVDVIISEKGQKLISELNKMNEDLDMILGDKLTEKESELLNNLLDKIRA